GLPRPLHARRRPAAQHVARGPVGRRRPPALHQPAPPPAALPPLRRGGRALRRAQLPAQPPHAAERAVEGVRAAGIAQRGGGGALGAPMRRRTRLATEAPPPHGAESKRRGRPRLPAPPYAPGA